MGNKYKAFISYSHKDRKWASWLHRRLESYTFPKHTVGRSTTIGPVPKNLKPIFRDREELAAADDLGQKIENALDVSENLIVICSAEAAASHWVNQEVLYFKRHNRSAKIFSVIIDGEPFADGEPGSAECLPEALRFEIGKNGQLTKRPAEPLAADLRPEGDGKRLGTLKLISGMAGLGLDDLVQRDLARARNRVMAITTGALATVLAMGTLTWFAIDARRDAEERRTDAEGLIEFMLTELRDKLEPVGRLDTLASVADKAIEYYENQDIGAVDCGATGRHAQALQFSSEIKYDAGELAAGADLADQAFDITERRLDTCDNREDALINHADSIFYKSFDAAYEGDMDRFAAEVGEYELYVDRYCAVNPDNDKCPINKAYALINLGAIALNGTSEDLDAALSHFVEAIRLYEKTDPLNSHSFKVKREYANAHGWLADTLMKQGDLDGAVASRKKEANLYERIRDYRQKKFATSELQLARDVGGAHLGQARALLSKGEAAEALAIADVLEHEANELTTLDPENKEYQKFKLWVLTAKALALFQAGAVADSCAAKTATSNYQTQNKLSSKIAPRFASRIDLDFENICNREN